MAAPTTKFESLVAIARCGDVATFQTLLTPYYALLLEDAQRRLPPQLQAKVGASDIVQDTIHRAWERLPTFAGRSEAEFRSWLLTLLRHHLIDWLRRTRREVALNLGSADARPEDIVPADSSTASAVLVEEERRQALLHAVERLKPDFRTVVLLRYLDCLAFEEIARRMSRSLDAVEHLHRRALAQLRQRIRDKV